MKDFKKQFNSPMPVNELRRCNEEWAVSATSNINKKMEAFQREFSSRSEMSQNKVSSFHFSC